MNEVHAFRLMYQRHERIMERRQARAEAEAAGAAAAFSPQGSPEATATPASPRAAEMRPAPVPEAPALPPAPAPRLAAVAPVDLSEGQLAAVLGEFAMTADSLPPVHAVADPVVPGEASPSPRPLSPAQAALLMHSFGIAGNAFAMPENGAEFREKDADPAGREPAPAPVAAETSTVAFQRFFPVLSPPATPSPEAADAYLGAVRNMERNLMRYGVR